MKNSNTERGLRDRRTDQKAPKGYQLPLERDSRGVLCVRKLPAVAPPGGDTNEDLEGTLRELLAVLKSGGYMEQ